MTTKELENLFNKIDEMEIEDTTREELKKLLYQIKIEKEN